jgi:hypothetical protein
MQSEERGVRSEERKESPRAERAVERSRVETPPRESSKPQSKIAPARVDSKSPTPEKLDALAEALKKLQAKAASTAPIQEEEKEAPVELVATVVEEKQKEVPLDQLKAVLGDQE